MKKSVVVLAIMLFSAATVNTVLHFVWNKNKRYKRKSKKSIEFKEEFPLVKI